MQIVSLSGPQKLTALAIFIGFVAIIVFVASSTLDSSSSGPAKIVKAPSSQPQIAAANKPAIKASPDSVAPSPAVKAQVSAKPVGTTVSANAVEAWTHGDGKSAVPQIPLNKVIRDYTVIEINPQPTTIPQVGETVSLPMLNGQKILVDVQATSTNPNGDKSWSGHLQGYGEDYPIIMTYGEHAIFAMITTPEGSYTMESTDGVGWLYKNPSELELSDASSKDFLEIPHSL